MLKKALVLMSLTLSGLLLAPFAMAIFGVSGRARGLQRDIAAHTAGGVDFGFWGHDLVHPCGYMGIKLGVASMRLIQFRIAGKRVRSKSPMSALWV